MKFVNLVKLSAVAMLLVTASASAQQITGTSHDIGNYNGNATGGGQICVYCHTPHNASALSTAPLLCRRVCVKNPDRVCPLWTEMASPGHPGGACTSACYLPAAEAAAPRWGGLSAYKRTALNRQTRLGWRTTI